MFWALVRRQHGVITHAQLLELGFTEKAIRHRVGNGRLGPIHRGVYVVGRPELTQEGRWMAAVLACGDAAVLSHDSAAALWGIDRARARDIHISLPSRRDARHRGIAVHRRRALADADVTRRRNIPVTSPACTIVDLAATAPEPRLERLVNEADKLGLIDPERLRREAGRMGRRRGARAVRTLLDRTTFTLSGSDLERLFLPIARAAGLPQPRTQEHVNGSRVDFHWPELGLVVETDGLSYHRTPTQQKADRVRDQAHAAAGLTPLRFTRAQVRFEPGHVEAVLAALAWRLECAR